MRRALLVLALGAGCDDVPQPYELDHSRIMAVRIDPPAIEPGARARVDVLVTDAERGPRVSAVDEMTITAQGVEVHREANGWFVTAPASPLAPLALVSLEVTSAEGPLAAQKTMAIGEPADNPPAPVILQDGAPAPRVMPADRDVTLTVVDVGPEASYRWFSSVGELTGYTRAEATLEPDAGATGIVGVVVRDQQGGTAWTLLPCEVDAP